MEYEVYGSKDSGELYSKGVSRAFGENKIVSLKDGQVFCSVLPLMCDPEDAGLELVGILKGLTEVNK